MISTEMYTEYRAECEELRRNFQKNTEEIIKKHQPSWPGGQRERAMNRLTKELGENIRQLKAKYGITDKDKLPPPDWKPK